MDRVELAEEARVATEADGTTTIDSDGDEDGDVGLFDDWFFQNSALADLAREDHAKKGAAAADASMSRRQSRAAHEPDSVKVSVGDGPEDSSARNEMAIGAGGGSGWFFHSHASGASQRSLGGKSKSLRSIGSVGNDLLGTSSKCSLAEAPQSNDSMLGGSGGRRVSAGLLPGIRDLHNDDVHQAVGLASHVGSSVAGSIVSDDLRRVHDPGT